MGCASTELIPPQQRHNRATADCVYLARSMMMTYGPRAATWLWKSAKVQWRLDFFFFFFSLLHPEGGSRNEQPPQLQHSSKAESFFMPKSRFSFLKPSSWWVRVFIKALMVLPFNKCQLSCRSPLGLHWTPAQRWAPLQGYDMARKSLAAVAM